MGLLKKFGVLDPNKERQQIARYIDRNYCFGDSSPGQLPSRICGYWKLGENWHIDDHQLGGIEIVQVKNNKVISRGAMREFQHTHVKTVVDGEYGWLDPRPRGHIRIKEDNKTLHYKLSKRKDLKEFKLWFEVCSEREYGNQCRLRGFYPEYHLEIGV